MLPMGGFCYNWPMMTACWFTHLEHGGFPIERAVLGTCDLSMLHVGGEWQWLVRQAGRDVAEGAARSSSAEMTYLTRNDPTRNIDRFYVVDITPTLFGEW